MTSGIRKRNRGTHGLAGAASPAALNPSLGSSPSPWETAYLRFQTPEQEIRKFTRRLRKLHASEWPRDSEIVELFCGRGNGLVALERMGFSRLEGVDLSPLLVAEYRGSGRILIGDCRQLPFADQSKDILIVQGGLHHLLALPEDLEQTLSEMQRVLRKDGLLVIVEPWATPFLAFVHAVCRIALVRRIWKKADALATMAQYEQATYEQWLSQPEMVSQRVYTLFAVVQQSFAWGKWSFVGKRLSGPRIPEATRLALARTAESEPPELSVVMPCLNERLSLGTCIQNAQDTMSRLGIRGEVVIADNGSRDGSQDIAENLGARLVSVSERGYGSALRGGIAAARGKYIIMGDSDASYDFTQLGGFVDKLRQGCDLVVGNRFQGGIRPGAMSLLHRFVGNPVLSWIGRLFFGCPVGDFHCGLRAFRKNAVEKLDLQSSGMEFASEMVVKAMLFKLNIAEIPTTLSPDRRERPPHLRTWRDGWRHLRFLLLYSPRWLFLYPGIALLVLGVAMGLWLLPGPQTVRGVTFDLHTLLFAAMAILVGFQSVYFAIFSKVFAISARLLPEDPRLTRVFRVVTLEVGLALGAFLALAGAGTWVFGLEYWRSRHFGPLDAEKTLRIVIPGLVCLTTGIQTILSSFLLSLLGMRRRGAPQA
jgi:glycosyltransferase involved in cell wall biosynthesis/ubiquinone/menaquinone biosynthesis C-methylase UbiE